LGRSHFSHMGHWRLERWGRQSLLIGMIRNSA
jgi:hypothetical protein